MEEQKSRELRVGPRLGQNALGREKKHEMDKLPPPLPPMCWVLWRLEGKGEQQPLVSGSPWKLIWYLSLKIKVGRRKQKESLKRKSLTITKIGFSLNPRAK